MRSPLDRDEKHIGNEASDNVSSGGVSRAEVMNKTMQTIRDQAYAECKGCTVGQLMGKSWEKLVVGWTFALNRIIEEMPEYVEAKRFQSSLEVVEARDFFVECLLGQALRMVRLCCFLEKTGVIAEIHENEDGSLCDHMMHGKLRGGMQEPGYDDNDWIVVKRTRKNPEEPTKLTPKKTFYSRAKFNFDVLAAASPGNAEEASWECNSCESSSKDSEETQETEVLRGGALGSATTNRKRQVADAVGQMEAILQSLQTQRPAEASQDEIGAIINDMKKTLAKWEENKPTKEEMKGQIATLLGRMKTSTGDDGPTSKPATTRQSFYTEFQKEAVRKYEENQKASKGAGKSTGKGKGKAKGKAKDDGLPKFDVRRAFPSLEITSWRLLQNSLEKGEEPQGMVAICPNLQTMGELQALSTIHGLQKKVFLVTKGDAKDNDGSIAGAKGVLLPYLGNLALVSAIVACSDGSDPQFDGISPIRAKDLTKIPKKENLLTLRLMVVKDLLSEKDMRVMESDPSYALELLGGAAHLPELRTNGWSSQMEVFIGYLELERGTEAPILAASGKSGVFVSHLRKTVGEWPNVSWRLPKPEEDLCAYHARVWQQALELKKPLAFRRVVEPVLD